MPQSKRKVSAMDKIPIIKFRLNGKASPKRKRESYCPERRKEVKEMRDIRACLRCSLMKIKCSNHDTCVPCSDLILQGYSQKSLSFSGCIRTRLYEVGFFEACVPNWTLRDSILENASTLDSTPISLEFDSNVTWNLTHLITDFDLWLQDPTESKTSRIGILSSPNFSVLISASIDDRQRLNFQRLVYAESLAHTQPAAEEKHCLSIPELRQIGAVAGQELLKYLDVKLKTQSLSKCSSDDFQALFLLVFGTILAISYAIPDDSSCDTQENGCYVQSLPQVLAMRTHLCQILAHHLVFLASQLKLSVTSQSEQFILENAPLRWHKKGRFQWLSTPDDAVSNHASSETIPNQEFSGELSDSTLFDLDPTPVESILYFDDSVLFDWSPIAGTDVINMSSTCLESEIVPPSLEIQNILLPVETEPTTSTSGDFLLSNLPTSCDKAPQHNGSSRWIGWSDELTYSTPQTPKRKRARYKISASKKTVASVRSIGACVSCSAPHMTCSFDHHTGSICSSCFKNSAVLNIPNQLSGMYFSSQQQDHRHFYERDAGGSNHTDWHLDNPLSQGYGVENAADSSQDDLRERKLMFLLV